MAQAIDVQRRQRRKVESLRLEIRESPASRAPRAIAIEIEAMLRVHRMLEDPGFQFEHRNAAGAQRADGLVLDASEYHHIVDLVLTELVEDDEEEDE